MTKNPLTITHPEIAKDWNLEGTGSLRPERVLATSREKVWWRCSEGHEYQVSDHSRVRSNGCKICQRLEHSKKTRLTKLKKSKSLAYALPQLIPEWNHEKNSPLTPDTVSYGSHILIWWKCTHGHEWQSTPQSRNRGHECPICAKNNAGDRVRQWRLEKAGQSFADAFPELLKEWDYKKNKLEPTEITPKSNYRAS